MAGPGSSGLVAALCLLLTAAPRVGAEQPSRSTQGASQPQDEAVQADSGKVDQKKVWYDEVVVTATRAPRRAGTIPLYTSVLEADQIQLAPDSGMLDLLRQVPSINMARETGTLVAQPRDQAISFRGLVGSVQSRALTQVDGMPIIDPYGGWVNLGLVPKELVDRVEIVRGGGSSAWGNLALSGVINLITRAPSSRQFGASVRVGDHSTQAADLFYTDAGSRWSGWIAGDHFDTNGYIVLAEPERGPVDQAKSRRNDALNARLGRTISPSTALTLRATYFDEHRYQGLVTDRDHEREASAAATLDHQRSAASSWQLQAYHRDLALSSRGGVVSIDRTSVAPNDDLTSRPTRSTGVSGTWSTVSGRHALTMGADGVEDRIDWHQNLGWDGTRYTSRYDVGGTQRFAGVFVQDTVTLSPRASLQLGARYDWVWSGDASSIRSSLLTGETTGSDPIADHSKSAFDPSLGFVVAPSSSVRFRGSVYTGFRYGTPSELFVGFSGGGRSVTVPNSALKPETLTGAELGLDYTPSRRTALRLTLFHNQVNDLMQRILVGSVGAAGGVVEPCGVLRPNSRCQQRRNLGAIRSNGVELGADWRPSDTWRWTLDATFMRSRVVDNPDDPSLVGNQVERAPDRQVAAGVEYSSPWLGHLLLRARNVGAAYDDTENTQYLPAHTLLDLGYSRDLDPSWQVFAGVENLLDHRYINRWSTSTREINGPRLVHVGFRFRFGE